jgi:uncharacterized protein
MLEPVKAFAASVSAGIGLAAYSLLEPHRYRLRTIAAPLKNRSAALRILHVSDTHMSGRNRRLAAYLKSLPNRLGDAPDLVLGTGDFIEDDAGIDLLVESLSGIKPRLGGFYVLGSHDYYQPRFQAYTKYVTGRRPIKAPRAATDTLQAGLESIGWSPLSNATSVVESGGGRIRLTGVDDPYLHRHRTGHIQREAGDALAVGLTHAPDVVSEFALAGYDLVVAGHTHGGQVRLPLVGALVTNCTLPAALAGGLNRIGDTWLHVSPGLGTGRFAPVRLNCPPEATLLELH